MLADGVDPAPLLGGDQGRSAQDGNPGGGGGDGDGGGDQVPPGYEKYAKMLKMHLPRGAVEHKMLADGVDPDAEAKPSEQGQ